MEVGTKEEYEGILEGVLREAKNSAAFQDILEAAVPYTNKEDYTRGIREVVSVVAEKAFPEVREVAEARERTLAQSYRFLYETYNKGLVSLYIGDAEDANSQCWYEFLSKPDGDADLALLAEDFELWCSSPDGGGSMAPVEENSGTDN